MSYECRVYDKTGKLIKIVSPKEMTNRSDKILLTQKSTIRAAARIKGYREPKSPDSHEKKFFNRFCIVCKKEFYSRHPYTKYCSHECQKTYYLNKKVILPKSKSTRKQYSK